jgi:hypothetical protein
MGVILRNQNTQEQVFVKNSYEKFRKTKIRTQNIQWQGKGVF